MDIRSTIVLVGPVITIGFAGALFGILQFLAVRRGGSGTKNLGAGGWGIGLPVFFAASPFLGIGGNGLITPFKVPIDVAPAFGWGPPLGAIGRARFCQA